MISEWMKIMLEEISRKKTADEEARLEERRRSAEHIDTPQEPRRSAEKVISNPGMSLREADSEQGPLG